MPHYHTHSGHHQPAPDASTVRSEQWNDVGTDTKHEAQQYQARIDSLAAEIADPMTSAQRRDHASIEKASLERALPLQLRAWAEIDARRAQKGAR